MQSRATCSAFQSHKSRATCSAFQSRSSSSHQHSCRSCASTAIRWKEPQLHRRHLSATACINSDQPRRLSLVVPSTYPPSHPVIHIPRTSFSSCFEGPVYIRRDDIFTGACPAFIGGSTLSVCIQGICFFYSYFFAFYFLVTLIILPFFDQANRGISFKFNHPLP